MPQKRKSRPAGIAALPGKLLGVTVRRHRVLLRTDECSAELTALDDGILRVLWLPPANWHNDPTDHLHSTLPAPRGAWRHAPRSRALRFGEMIVRFAKNPLRLTFADARGPFLAEAKTQLAGYFKYENGIGLSWIRLADDRLYGLGYDPSAEFDRSASIRLLRADHSAHVGGDVPIPFFLSSRGFGVCPLNPAAGNIAMTTTPAGRRIDFHATDGYPAYAVLFGPTMADVLRRYARLTGPAPLPPRWFFGPLFSRIPGTKHAGYRNTRELRALGRRMRTRRIPADALIVDYQWDRRIGEYQWDRKSFADMPATMKSLRKLGLKTILILKPAVNVDAKTAPAALRANLILRRMDGSPHTGDYHRGRSMFLDVTRRETGAWLSRQLDRLARDGVAGWWTDEGEWLGYLEDSARDLATNRRLLGNLYNNLWCRAIYEGRRARSNQRVVNITRGGWAGIQRYGTTLWTGDVSTTWESLAGQVPRGLSAAMSGIPFWTTDGGGFLGSDPSPELYVRWAQFAAFSPICRFHGCGPREPWYYGAKAEAAAREILEWRMRLMPYIYTAAWAAHRDGLPMMRPLALAFPDEPAHATRTDAYMFGPSLLVRPIIAPRLGSRMFPDQSRDREGVVTVKLPRGDGRRPATWFDFWTGQPLRAGTASCPLALNRIPLFVRAPAILVLAEPARSAGEQSWERLTLRVYVPDPGAAWRADAELYEDDGDTYAYERGQFSITRITAHGAGGRAQLTITPDRRARGRRAPRRRWRVEVICQHPPRRVRSGGIDQTLVNGGDSTRFDIRPADSEPPSLHAMEW